MVKTQISEHARIVRNRTKDMITKVFGRTLTLRVMTRTLDALGQVVSIATSDTTFIGDIQFGMDLDQRYLSSGIVEVGEAILYIDPTALSTLPVSGDSIIDGNSVWEVHNQIESPELGGSVTHYSYRCKREINTSDV